MDQHIRRQAGAGEGGVPVGNGGIADLNGEGHAGVPAAQHVPGEGVAHIGHLAAGHTALRSGLFKDGGVRLTDAGGGGHDDAAHQVRDAVILQKPGNEGGGNDVADDAGFQPLTVECADSFLHIGPGDVLYPDGIIHPGQLL